VVTGEAEADMDKVLHEQVWPAGWTWLRSPSLDALSGLLRLSSFYLGNDSGITHLAAACGSDVIALFLEENVTAWQPLGRVHLLSAASLDSISVEMVWRMVEGRLRLPNKFSDLRQRKKSGV
jgi:ADP-heptose:LPS heptosyltransferase